MADSSGNIFVLDHGETYLSVWTGWDTGFSSPHFPPQSVTLIPAEVRWINRKVGGRVNLSFFGSPEFRWDPGVDLRLRARAGIGLGGDPGGPWQNMTNLYLLTEVDPKDPHPIAGVGIDVWTQAFFGLPGIWAEFKVEKGPDGWAEESIWVGLRRVHWGIPSLVRKMIHKLRD